jgi:hypothetical protein
MPSTDLDDEWIQMVVKAGKMEESFLAEDKLLRGHQDKPQERKSNPVKGKEIATGSRSRGGGDFNVGMKQHFLKLKNMMNLTSSEAEEWKKRLAEITGETLSARRAAKACLRCGVKDHSQWYCPESQPKAAVISVQSVQPQKQKQEEAQIKEELAPPDK